ncbi:MAG: mechanosensitive ion channel family protein [Nostocaceae cyanobacterium]|nr:mechanosensitive ion channel family protein [Nostocaceae cyanobacterium]
MNAEISTAWGRVQAMIDGFVVLLPSIVLALILFTVFYLVAKGVRKFVRRLTRRHRNARNLGLVLGRLAQGIIILVGLFLSLTIVIPSLKVGDIVQLLGISGVAIGFAFRDILQNFLAGILILLNEAFNIGDQIVFKSFEGTVENIETRATTIRTYDGRRIVIPNSELFTNSVTVNTAFENRRIQYDVGIGYGDDIELAKQLILEVLHETEGILQKPAPDAIVVDLGDSTVKIRARWWVEPPTRAEVLDFRDKVLTRIKNKLTANGIDLPFPTQQILFHDQTEETDGDRYKQREGWPAGQNGVPRSKNLSSALYGILEMGSNGNSRENNINSHYRESDR